MNRTRPAPFRASGGYTLLEILTVLVLAGVILALAMPRLTGYLRHMGAKSTADRVAADLAYARIQAVRGGQTVSLRVLDSDRYEITRDDGDVVVETLKRVRVSREAGGIGMQSGDGIRVAFDSRGMLRTGSDSEIVVTGASNGRTIRITPLGKVDRVSP